MSVTEHTTPCPEVADAIDRATAEWARTWPDLDVRSGEVLARIQRLAQLIEEAQTRRLRRRPGMEIANLGDFDVLRALRRVGPPYALTSARLHESMLVSAAGLSGRLKRLEGQGWITRTVSDTDRRSTLVSLTEEAVADLDNDLPAHYSFEADLLTVLGPAEREHLATTLRVLLADREH